MEYSRIVAVTGMPGLYEILSSKTDGAIVRSLDDETTKFVASRVHNLSHLESIEIYTTGDNVTLADVFASMKENKDALPDTKDNKALKAYFEKAYPTMDTERVYSSDMKKMVNWFTVLEKHQVDFTPNEEPQEEDVEVLPENEAPATTNNAEGTPEESEQVKEVPAKKAASKKVSNTDTDEASAKEGTEAPKKKASARKKKSEE